MLLLKFLIYVQRRLDAQRIKKLQRKVWELKKQLLKSLEK